LKKKLYLQTTEVSCAKTASQIVEALVGSGAREILSQYEGGKLVGIRFSLEQNKGQTQIYSLPARTEPVYQILCEQKSYGFDREKLLLQAEKVAWRLLLRWVQSQLALIQVGMVQVEEVFLPYRQGQDGRTFWELVQAGGHLALPEAPKVANISEKSRT
jgi:hypothetical protein